MADAITTKNITSVDEVQSVDNTDKVFVNDNGSFKQISVSNLMKQAPSGVTEETDPTVSEWAKQPTKPSYTADEVGALPVGTKIPTKTSDLTNDSGYLTQIPEEYVTETELGQKGYVIEDDIPEKLPSPGTLTFTGAVNDTYDGSVDKTINIPTGGGGATPEQIQQAVDAYLEENPVQPGATVEQVAQIEKNKTDISSVKEDVSSLSEDISNVGRYILYNAFDITNIKKGGFWSQTNGNFTSVQTFNACNRYVEVESNKNYYGYYVDDFGVYREATSSIIACWYDVNKKFISGQYTGDTNVFLSPENAKFVRLSYVNKYEVIVFTEIENIKNPNTTEYLRKFITFDSEKIVNIEEKTTILEGKVLSIEETLSSTSSDLSVSYEQNEDGFLLKSADGDDELSLEVFNQKGNNNSFNFGWFKKNNINYKQMSDDIAPFFCDNTYIGSNHGNSVAFALTCENHGKTEQDIGSIYLNRSTNYIILKIIDDNTLWLLGEPLDATYFGIYRFPTTALEGNELTHVSGGVNTSSIVFSSQTRLVQIVPCIKNKRVVYLSDGKEIENTSGRCSTFTISLQYETIDLVKVYEYLKQNVGSNTNQSYYDSNIESDMIFISDFQISGKLNIVVNSYVTILRENANGYRYSVMQAEAFSTGTRKTYVPFSNYDTPQNVSSISLKIGDWKNENIPPYKFYQFDNNMENGWVIGYDILQKDTSPETRKSNLSDGTVTCFDLITGTSKMYPYTCNSAKLFQFGETYGGRAYCGRVKVVDNAVVFTYKTKNYTIVEIECFEQCELRNILLDTSLQGKNVEIVNSSGGIKILNSFVSKDGIYWLSTEKGSVTLKVF